MNPNNKFDYVNESSISDDLLCPICTGPFDEPVCSDQCGHTFCRTCITYTYKSLTSCPTCRTESTLEDYRPITVRPFLNQLNQLKVKCKACSQSNIQRGDFKEHLNKCVEARIGCSAAALGCKWEGKRSEVDKHAKECPLIMMKPMFDQLNAKIERQSKQIEFFRTLFEKISDSNKQRCTEVYRLSNGRAFCDICRQLINLEESKSYFHFCPNTDFCGQCVKEHFK